jgi:Trk K+ transport system NAD-binding subunit
MGGRDIGRMLVVSPSNPNQMVGWLRRSDLLRAYDVALTKRAAQRHRAHQVRLGAISGENVRVFEIPVEAGALCDGKRVKDINWPSNCLLASVRNGRNVIIPHGDTILKAGNILAVLIEGGSQEPVSHLCGVPEQTEQL